MRRLLTVTGLALASTGLLAGQADATTLPPPKGTYYGQLSGSFQQLVPSKCPAPLQGAPGTSCLRIKGPFNIATAGGAKLTGTYTGYFVPGNPNTGGTGSCTSANELFTFTVGTGNTFEGIPPVSGADRMCLIDLGYTSAGPDPTIGTTFLDMDIFHGTGRFTGMNGTLTEYGAIVGNVGPTGAPVLGGKTIGGLRITFSPPTG